MTVAIRSKKFPKSIPQKKHLSDPGGLNKPQAIKTGCEADCLHFKPL